LLRCLDGTLGILRQQQPLGDLPRRLATHRGDIDVGWAKERSDVPTIYPDDD
jgi:hypothetical protein